jgi:hypothetical protein
MIRIEERKRATALKAVDVREMIKTSLPAVLPQLTAAHIDQLQRVLDVAVINADIEGKGEVLDQQSIRGKIIHSNEYLRNPTIVAQRNKMLAQKINLKPSENVIRLDHRRLLTADALKPTSDNPDEAAYLLVIAEVYENRGVWLVLDSSMGAMTRQMSPTDPRKWRVRLLLGYKPGGLVEEIETANGGLNRSALLSVQRVGAGYYEWVHRGPTLMALEKALSGLSKKLTDGWNEHTWWSAHRAEFNIVSKVSDFFGGADWPNESIWDQPHKIYVEARNLINAGKLVEASKYALLAAYQAQWCASGLHEYVKDTTKGATRVVKILEIAVVCGEIAGFILTVMAVGHGLIRLLSRKGGQAALQGGAQRQLTGGQRQLPAPAEPVPTPTPGGVAPGAGRGQTVVENTLAPVKPGGPRVQRFNTDVGEAVDKLRQHLGLAPRTLRGGELGFADDLLLGRVHKQFTYWLTKNPRATLDQKLAELARIKDSWGLPPFLD